MYRKALFVLSTVLVAVFVLTACTPAAPATVVQTVIVTQPAPATQPPMATVDESKVPITITFAHSFSQSDRIAFLNSVGVAYTKLHPNVTVVFDQLLAIHMNRSWPSCSPDRTPRMLDCCSIAMLPAGLPPVCRLISARP